MLIEPFEVVVSIDVVVFILLETGSTTVEVAVVKLAVVGSTEQNKLAAGITV